MDHTVHVADLLRWILEREFTSVYAEIDTLLHPGLPVMYTSGRRSTTECLDPVEGSMFIPKPYDPFRIGQLLEYLVAMKSIPVAHKVAGMV